MRATRPYHSAARGPCHSLHHELERHVEAGFTRMAAIQARLEKEAGTIAAGDAAGSSP